MIHPSFDCAKIYNLLLLIKSQSKIVEAAQNFVMEVGKPKNHVEYITIEINNMNVKITYNIQSQMGLAFGID